MLKAKRQIAGIMAACMMATSFMPTVTYAMDQQPVDEPTISASESEIENDSTDMDTAASSTVEDEATSSVVSEPNSEADSSVK